MKKTICLLTIAAFGTTFAASKYMAIISELDGEYTIPPRIIGTEYGEWSNYEEVGANYECNSFTAENDGLPYPNYDYVSHTGSVFKLSLGCKQDYSRKRDVFDKMSNNELIKTGEEQEDMTLNVTNTVMKDAMVEDVYVKDSWGLVGIQFYQDLSGSSWYYANVVVDRNMTVRISNSGGSAATLNELRTYGYELGEELERNKYAIRMINAPSVNVWKVTSFQELTNGQDDCGSTPIDDFTNYEGEICSSLGATKTMCTHLAPKINPTDWKKVTVTCEEW